MTLRRVEAIDAAGSGAAQGGEGGGEEARREHSRRVHHGVADARRLRSKGGGNPLTRDVCKPFTHMCAGTLSPPLSDGKRKKTPRAYTSRTFFEL